jgi:glucose-6-phosphate isomerase
MKSRLDCFDLRSGLSPDVEPIPRRLSEMKNMYADEARRAAMQSVEDVLVYEFYDLGIAEGPGDIAYGTSMVFPGRVGDEYFMTKGHFHTILDTAEVYYCLQGHGYLLMESPEGDCEAREMTQGSAVYVPGRYAHRSVNVSSTEKLVTFFAFRADAGHDYGTIETQGFRNLLVERDGKPTLIDNPKWVV